MHGDAEFRMRRALEAAEAVREREATREATKEAECKCAVCDGPFDNDFGTDICRMCEQTAAWREPFAS